MTLVRGEARKSAGTWVTLSVAAMPLSTRARGNSGSVPPSSEIANTGSPNFCSKLLSNGANCWQYGQSLRKRKNSTCVRASCSAVRICAAWLLPVVDFERASR